MTRDVVIIGAGGFGREVAQLVRDIESDSGVLRFAGYLDDDQSTPQRIPSNESWLGSIDAFRWEDELAFCAVGDPRTRRLIVDRLRARRIQWATLRHPSAVIGERCALGPGSVVCAGAVLTVDITIGAHVHVNLLCSVGHDVHIDDFATLSPGCGISGGAQIGSRAFLGTQAVLLPNARVGADAVVGAGSVVLKTVPEGVTVVGVPARRLG